MCLLKVGIPLESKPGNQLSSRDELGYTELSSSCCAELGVPLDFGPCSRESLELPKGSQAICHVSWRMRYGCGANAVESGLNLR